MVGGSGFEFNNRREINPITRNRSGRIIKPLDQFLCEMVS